VKISELEAFEKTIRRYEQESSKSIDDEMLMGIIINGIQDNNIRPRHQECFKADLIPKCDSRTARDVSHQLGAGANAQPDGNRSRKVKRATARAKENRREKGMVSKGKQNPQRKPNAAAPHGDEPEPLSAAVDGTLPDLIAAFPGSCKTRFG